MNIQKIILLLLGINVVVTVTFVYRTAMTRTMTHNKNNHKSRRPQLLVLGGSKKSNDKDGESDEDMKKNRTDLRTDLRHFLTQRAFQSFSCHLLSARDPHTVNYLEEMLDFDTGLLNFHGTGGFNITKFPKWDSVLFDLVSRPKHEIIIESVRRVGPCRGGWSKNNPYIKHEDSIVEFTIDIEPVSLTQRILSVREQLAREFEKDLNVVLMQGDYILETYNTNVRRQRDDEDSHSREVEELKKKKQAAADDDDGEEDEDFDVDESDEDEVEVESESSHSKDIESKKKLRTDDDKENLGGSESDEVEQIISRSTENDEDDQLISGSAEEGEEDDDLCELDLDDYANPYKCESLGADGEASPNKNNSKEAPKIATFDRQGTFFMTNNMAWAEKASSPLRKANYDLLTLLATQAAMHELLRKYKAIVEETSSPKAKAIFEYLTDFYALRVRKHFDGDGMLGRAEDFIEELLLSSPKVSGEGNNMTIIDPLALTEQLLAFRRDIATEWKDICLSVPQDHTELRKQILVNQMKNQEKSILEQVFEDSDEEQSPEAAANSVEEEGFQ